MAAADLHVVESEPKGGSGDRPTVILVHGAWHGAWCWERHFIEHFAKAGFRVLAPDLRGHGKSAPVRAMHWNRIADYTDDIVALVEAQERPPILIGHSMGGFVTQHCMRRTGHLAGAGLMATVPHYGVIRVASHIAVTRPVDFGKCNLFWTLYPLVRDPEKARRMFLEDHVEGAELAEFAARLTDESYWAFLDMLFLDLPRRYEGEVPVFVVAGEKDRLFSVSEEQATARHYGAECRVIENAPHDLMLASRWKEAADALVNWADSL